MTDMFEGEVAPVPKSRDVQRAIVRLIQELEAVDWYHAPIGVLALDVHALILAWNGAAGEILGVREWEVLGTPLLALFNEDQRPQLDRLIALCITADTGCSPEVFERRSADGRPQFVEVTAAGLRSRTGEPGATVLLQDVTARVIAEQARAEAERRFRGLVQGVDAVVWEGSPDSFRFTFVSQRAEEMLGFPVAQWLSEPDFWSTHMHPEDRGRTVAAARAAIAERRDHELEYRMLAADAREVWLRDKVSVIPGEDGHPARLLGVMFDVTESKRMEEALARLYKEAEAETRRKDEFLAILGHELRNPLAAITNAVQLIELAPTSPERVGQAREVIARQTRHLTHLMNELLDVSRIGSGKLTLERKPVDLSEVAKRSIQGLVARAKQRGQELALDGASTPVVVVGDAVRLEQVLTNLIDNAVKYTAPGGRITVTIRSGHEHAELSVRDTGVGIAREQLPLIFGSFYQVDRSPDPTNGGLGLGLTLARRLTEAHGGRLIAHSDGPGHGSEFVVRLPLRRQTGEPSEPATPEPPRRSCRVLVIEDNADSRDMYKTMLEFAGHVVEVAPDGPRGIELARAGEPDVIVIDIGLPGLEGYEVARLLRTRGGPGPLLIALTGYSQPEDRRRAAEAGFDAYLVKPLDPAELSRLIGQAVKPKD